MNAEYTLLLLVCLSVPFVYSFHKQYGFGKNYKYAIIAITVTSIPYILWDIWATERGHWWFNPDYTYQILIANLPIEEVAFFFVIPFCCLFTWNAMKNNQKATDK